MPLVVKELHIKVAVSPPDGRATSSTINANTSSGSTGVSKADQKQIVAACIEQVLEILREKEEA